MKIKRMLAGLLCSVIFVFSTAACSADKTGSRSEAADKSDSASETESQPDSKDTNGENYHTLYFRDSSKREDVTAVFCSVNSDQTEKVKMTAVGEDKEGFTYSCRGDASAYNMVSFRYDGFSTSKVAFNKCVSGWCNCEYGFLPFTYGLTDQYKIRKDNRVVLGDSLVYDNKLYDEVTLKFNGYDKVIHIWKPSDYDPSSKEKYATVYLLDGQSMLYLGFPDESLRQSEHADIQTESMTSVTGYKAIVVGIDNFGDPGYNYSRLDELTPDLGELAYNESTQKKGSLLSVFVAESVVPYIQQHYNVYTDAVHTSVAGKSLGGLESFYIALEHPELFGTAGVFSPSFMLYSDEVWRAYLGKKSLDDHSPFLYFYSGNEKEDNGDVTDEMVARIKDMGYPAKRFAYHRDAIGGHESYFWRSNFSKFLNAMVYQRVESLENSSK